MFSLLSNLKWILISILLVHWPLQYLQRFYLVYKYLGVFYMSFLLLVFNLKTLNSKNKLWWSELWKVYNKTCFMAQKVNLFGKCSAFVNNIFCTVKCFININYVRLINSILWVFCIFTDFLPIFLNYLLNAV